MAENNYWEIEAATGGPASRLSVRDVVKFLTGNIILLGGGLLIGLGAGILAQQVIPKAYQSKGDFLVDEVPFSQTSRETDAETNRDLVQTLILSIPNRDMLAAVERRLGLEKGRIAFSDLDLPMKLEGETPKANISVTPMRNSRIGMIEATSQSPEFASAVVNAILDELGLYNRIGGRFSGIQFNLQLNKTRADSILKQLLDVTAQRIKLEQENAELNNYTRLNLPLESFPAFSKDDTLNNVKTQLILVDSEYKSVSSASTRGARLIGKQAELDSLRAQLSSQAQRLAASLRSEYDIIATQERNLQDDFKKAKDQIEQLTGQAAVLAQSFGDPRAMEKLAAETSDANGQANIIVVVDRATPQSKPIRPKLVLNVLLGVIFGGALGLGLAMLRVLLDNRIMDASRVENELGLPCLAVLPRRPSLASGSMQDRVFNHPVYPISLGFLRSHLLHASLAQGVGSVIGFTPASPAQSSSSLVTDLAILLAQAEKRTLVVDLNFSAPRSAKTLGIDVKKGLETWLASDEPISSYINYSTVRELAVLSVESRSRDMDDLLSRRPLANELSELLKNWDFILIDAPSIRSDWGLMLCLPPTGSLVVTAEWKKTRTDNVQQTLARTRGPGWKILGVVLLNAPRRQAS